VHAAHCTPYSSSLKSINLPSSIKTDSPRYCAKGKISCPRHREIPPFHQFFVLNTLLCNLSSHWFKESSCASSTLRIPGRRPHPLLHHCVSGSHYHLFLSRRVRNCNSNPNNSRRDAVFCASIVLDNGRSVVEAIRALQKPFRTK
jgi:hypothetical protein